MKKLRDKIEKQSQTPRNAEPHKNIRHFEISDSTL